MDELNTLRNFHDRTMLTFGTKTSRLLYQREAPRLALAHPFLLHIALNATMVHDRIMTSSEYRPQSPAEIYHWCKGVTQYNKVLNRKNTTSSEKDAIWVAAMLLSYTTLAQVEGDYPEDVWPLSAPCKDKDLDWLKLFAGTQQVCNMVKINKVESPLQEIMKLICELGDILLHDPDASLASLPPSLVEMCGLRQDGGSDSPLYAPTVMLGNILKMDLPHLASVKFSIFVKRLSPDFVALLQRKEPRALLLLAYFHAKAGQDGPSPWWAKRAALEGLAICLYLERHYYDVSHMMELLEAPRRCCQANAAALKRSPNLLTVD